MKKSLSGFAAALVICTGLLSAAGQAVAADGTTKTAKVKKPGTKVVKIKPADSGFLYGSQETQSMRDKRLRRECRGAANGGACSGYTR
jgi:uncharacterized protein YfiM (DUF2279 family)